MNYARNDGRAAGAQRHSFRVQGSSAIDEWCVHSPSNFNPNASPMAASPKSLDLALNELDGDPALIRGRAQVRRC